MRLSTTGHLVLAAFGVAVLVWLALPLRAGSWISVDVFVWVTLAVAAVVSGGVAGLVEGALAAGGVRRTGLVVAGVVMLPLLWLAGFFVGRWFGDLTSDPQPPDTLVVPAGAWLLGVAVLHIVSERAWSHFSRSLEDALDRR